MKLKVIAILSQANIKLLVDQKDPIIVTTNNRNEILLHKEPNNFKAGHSYIVKKLLERFLFPV